MPRTFVSSNFPGYAKTFLWERDGVDIIVLLRFNFWWKRRGVGFPVLAVFNFWWIGALILLFLLVFRSWWKRRGVGFLVFDSVEDQVKLKHTKDFQCFKRF